MGLHDVTPSSQRRQDRLPGRGPITPPPTLRYRQWQVLQYTNGGHMRTEVLVNRVDGEGYLGG